MKNYTIKGHSKTKVRSNSRLLKVMGISLILYRQNNICYVKIN